MVQFSNMDQEARARVLSALDFSPYGLNHEAATQEVPYNHEYHMALILIK